MNKQQQPTSFSTLIEKLRNEYAQLEERVGSLHSFLCDIDFEKRVPDPVEQRLMREQMNAMLHYMDNLRGRVSYHEDKQLREMVDKCIPQAPIATVGYDEHGNIIISQDAHECDFDAAHHCGQDVKEFNPVFDEHHHCGCDCSQESDKGVVNEVPGSIKKLEGMQVFGVFPKGWKCSCCFYDEKNKCTCHKVELVGGYYLCLAPLPNSIITE